MNCESYQERIDEHLAVGVPADLLPGTLLCHLEACSDCREFVQESLELGRLLEEPLPLPPAELVERVMEAVKTPAAEPALGMGERLVWATLGGLIALGLQSMSWDAFWQATSQGWSELSGWWTLQTPTLPVLDAGSTWPLALALGGLQVVSLWILRRRETLA
ncbi:MAG: hypothetical protein KC910_31630 [Candidatus Eremiobacteraeota bacterium]|nr:hypothetical protein [Candidatus Eremiobacteraeota bacterium]